MSNLETTVLKIESVEKDLMDTVKIFLEQNNSNPAVTDYTLDLVKQLMHVIKQEDKESSTVDQVFYIVDYLTDLNFE